MLTLLLHSSKTMRPAATEVLPYQAPHLQSQANELARYVQSLSAEELASSMKLSSRKADETHAMWQSWHGGAQGSRPAIDAFLGDIYSGLQVATLTEADRHYANDHLLILSGLYGGLRALDSILPYRLEMGYHLPSDRHGNLYRFWGDAVAQMVSPTTTAIVNLSAVEYTKALLPHITTPVVTPRFLTRKSSPSEPVFVTVHAKIARGAFAHWMLTQRISDVSTLRHFAALGYQYDAARSTDHAPVFVCEAFGGLGLSVRKS